MDDKHIQRLREEQQMAIQQTRDKMQTLNKFKEDYLSLQNRLKSLPDKVTHNVMVPFGKKAFMPGQLVHTNEILVLLGDNWFANRSAKQATEIVDRRMSVLDIQISELEQQLGLLTPRLEYTSELQAIAEQKGDVVEITEEYDAEKEHIWRERHKENIRKYNAQLRDEQQQAVLQEQRDRKEQEQMEEERRSESALWARLDQLAMQEEDQGELNMSSSESSNSDDQSDSSEASRDSEDGESNRKVKWKDEPQTLRARPCSVIRFSHSSYPTQEAIAEDTSVSSSPSVTSPADIYNRFVKKNVPKSILKHSCVKREIQSEPVKENVILPAAESAFSGAVVEKSTADLPTPEILVPLGATTKNNSEVPQAVPKTVSRFKARRMQSKT